MRNVIAVLFACAVVLCLPACHGSRRQGTSTATVTDKGLWCISYKIEGERLDFAVIAGPGPKEQPLPGRVTMDSFGGATFNHPNGSEVRLDGSGRLLQVSGTTVIESSQKISGSDFQAFLDSHPQDYSLGALQAFARERSANPQPGSGGQPKL